MSEWWNLKSAIASIDSRLDQAIGVPAKTQESQLPDPTPITPVADFELPEDQLKFLDLYTARFESQASKIKHLAAENVRLLAGSGADPAAATAKKIDLLLEEGTRLSAQELKLNSTIKRLRVQAQESAKNDLGAALEASKREIDQANAAANARVEALEGEIRQKTALVLDLERQLDEQSAAVEHYKHRAGPDTSASSSALDSLTQNHEAARENWLAVESRLLSTIASLESTIEQRDAEISRLNGRIDAAAVQSQELRDLAKADKQQLTGAKSEWSAQEKDLRQQITDLEARLKAHLTELESMRAAQEAGRVGQASPQASPAPAAPHELYDDVDVPPLEPLEDLPESVAGSIDSRHSVTNESPDTHIVAKLSQTNRRLEAQLLMAQESLEATRREKESAYTEMVKYMSAGESAQQLEQENKQLNAKLETLLVALGQKSEKVTELEADVEDLKEMYKDQVTQLVGQIEKLQPR